MIVLTIYIVSVFQSEGFCKGMGFGKELLTLKWSNGTGFSALARFLMTSKDKSSILPTSIYLGFW